MKNLILSISKKSLRQAVPRKYITRVRMHFAIILESENIRNSLHNG